MANPAAPSRVDNDGHEESVHYELRIRGLLDTGRRTAMNQLSARVHKDAVE